MMTHATERLVEAANRWAEPALQFAWPMLWQSSLLIGGLWALDLILKERLRPAVRYALWLVVLVKLLLPPSLAFPTSPCWWLRPAKTVSITPEATKVVTSTSEAAPRGFADAAVLTKLTPPAPRLSSSSWVCAGAIGGILGLLAWLLVRWWQVVRDARRAVGAPGWLERLLPEQARPTRIKLTERAQSPAVCGLVQPVILLPRALTEELQPRQLRAVLLHEWFHLRRGDVWVNCLQALVQIAYWWHPLLWLANARIRRLREEAVDDAVMLALAGEAESYAPTLLEVAKLSLGRPQVSLGLVGILESRSSLRQRIERLVDFRPPRKSGLTIGSSLAVLAFAALAMPMGEAPAPSAPATLAIARPMTNGSGSKGITQVDLTKGGELPAANAPGGTESHASIDVADSSLDLATTSPSRLNAVAGSVPPQINLQCRIVEIANVDPQSTGFDWYLGNVLTTNSAAASLGGAPAYSGIRSTANPAGVFPGLAPGAARDGRSTGRANTASANPQFVAGGTNRFAMTGLLTDPQYRVVLKALEQRSGTDLLAQPAVVTVSGRQVQCKVTQVSAVVKGIEEQALKPPGISRTNGNAPYAVGSIDCGIALDMFPCLTTDGDTITLPVIATLTEFLEYNDPGTNRVAVYVNGKQIWLAPPQPKIQTRQMWTTVAVPDGQTLVLGGLTSERIVTMKYHVPVLGDLPLVGRLFRSESKSTQKKNLLIFITATIIDATGNRVHADQEGK